MTRQTMVVGIGNELRGDDAAGPVAARRVKERDPCVTLVIVHQLSADLALSLGEFDCVVFLDADPVVDHAVIALVRTSSATILRNSHHVTPEQLVALAQALDAPTPPVVLHAAIPARSFAHGASLSPLSVCGVEECVEAVCGLIGSQAKTALV